MDRSDIVTIGLDEFIERLQDNYLLSLVRSAEDLSDTVFFSKNELIKWLLTGEVTNR